MRVAWIAPNGGNFTLNGLKGTGGWISSLETALLEYDEDVELGIVFTYSEDILPIKSDRVTYYPVYRPSESNVQKLYHRWFRSEEKYEDGLVQQMVNYVEQFNPDIVHIWGCENFYIKILKYIHCPSVVHIQGVATSIIKNYLPHGVGVTDIVSQDGIINKYILKRGDKHDYNLLCCRARTERVMAQYITNWIGRTEWDRASAYCLAPKAKYFHCDELMRNEFYEHQWQYHYNGKLIIQSSISNTWYKGVDVVLKTAQTLKSLGVDFEWNVYGVTEKSSVVRFFSRRYHIEPKSVNVNLLGYVDGATIMQGLLKSDVYVHPSYIENSSNAIAEAMIIGVPVVAQYVGGNPTMLKDDSGVLVQPNDSSVMAYAILQMRNQDAAIGCSERGRKIAVARHNKNEVVRSLLTIYQSIVDGNN